MTITVSKVPKSRPQILARPVFQTRADRSFAILCGLVTLRSVGPGVLNYLVEVHLTLFVSQTAPRTAAANALSIISAGLLLIFCVRVLLGPGHEDRRAGGLVIFLGAVLGLALVHFQQISGHDWLDILVTAAIAGAVWHIRPPLRSARWLALCSGAVAAWSIYQGAVNPDHAFFLDHYGNLDRSVKALIGSNQLAGPFGHSNTLGLYVSLSVPFAFLIRPILLRALCLGVLLYAAAWATSRTSLIALVVGLALVFLRWFLKTEPRAMRAIAQLVLAAAVLVIVGLPLLTTDPNSFTNRGAIWIGSLAAVSHAPVLGLGPDWYSLIGQVFNTLGNEASSGHNLFVSEYTEFGLVGLLVVAAVVARMVYIASLGPFRHVAIEYLGVFLAASIFEYIWQVTSGQELFPVTGFVFLLVLVQPAPGDTVTFVSTLHGIRQPLDKRK